MNGPAERAAELLRRHLSPQQLAEYESKRYSPGPDGTSLRWFNVIGTLGGTYTVWGVDASVRNPEYCGVGFGRNCLQRSFCVNVFAPDQGHLPAADQMLAYKLVLESDEALFLFKAPATTTQSQSYQYKHRPAMEAVATRPDPPF